MKKISNNIYYLENNFLKTNRIRKTILLKEELKENKLILSLISNIANNAIKTYTSMEFANLKATNYDLSYNVSLKEVDNSLLMNIDIIFIDYNIINDPSILETISKILDGLTLVKSEIGIVISDYISFLEGIEDKKDKYVKRILNDIIYKENEFYLSYKESLDLLKKLDVKTIEDIFELIDVENYYLIFEGSENSLKKIENLLFEKENKDLKIFNDTKTIINKDIENIEKINGDKQVSIALNFQGEVLRKEEFSLKILSLIFGRGVYSKLFKNVREKMSLCYSIYSVEDNKYGLDVFTGVDLKNKDIAINEIQNQFNEIKKGNIKEEFDLAKKDYLNQIKANKKEFITQANYLEKNIIINEDIFINENIEKIIEEINEEDIIKLANKLELKKKVVIN